MQFSLLTLTTVVTLALAAPAKKHLKVDFQKTVEKHTVNPNQLSNGPLKSPLETTLINHVLLYNADIYVGTPPQKVEIDLDTGSSDLWIEADGSDGAFLPQNSTTNKPYHDNFLIEYGDLSSASGSWVTDVVEFAGAKIENYIFGQADQTNAKPVFGIGYSANEASASALQDKPFSYDNYPLRLVKDGWINTPSYSLYLNSFEAKSGTLLFGAVDKSKIDGPLLLLPIIKDQPSDPKPKEFLITLSSVDGSVNGTSFNALDKNRHVLIDSGSSNTYLPPQSIRTIAKQFNLMQVDGGWGLLKEGVDALSDDDTLTFNLQGVKIVAKVKDLFTPAKNAFQDELYVKVNGKNELFYQFQVNDGGDTGPTLNEPVATAKFVFGDSFLRSAYVVYDLGADQVAIGQAKYGTATEDIVDIEAGKDGIPSATTATEPVWTSNAPITTSVEYNPKVWALFDPLVPQQ